MNLLQAALGYAERGWRVFPLHGIVNARCTCGRSDCGSAGKHPLVRRGLHEATTNEEQLRTWWQQWRSANIGIATGADSGMVVVDIDLGHRTNTAFGSPGEAKSQEHDHKPNDVWDSVGRLIDQGLEPTLTGLTGGGGFHLIYRCSDENLGNSAGRLPGIDGDLAGIDLRCNGGYIVAPPSIHMSGERYEWLDLNAALATAPRWLNEPERSFVEAGDVVPVDFDGHGTAYDRAALNYALASLRGAPARSAQPHA